MRIEHSPESLEEYVLDLRKEELQPLSGHLQLGGASPQGERIDFTSYYMTLNGALSLPVMGEFHFSRFPSRFWEHELRKMQAGGIQIIATYVFWLHVEEDEGVFDWSGDRDVRTFVSLCEALGLKVILRIGPFAHGECRNGGLPDWLYGRPFVVRSNDEAYLSYVARYYHAIAGQVKGLLFKDGGPVIGIQLENEYMHAGAPWEVTFRQGTEWVPRGADGAAHLQILKRIALDAGFEVPIYSCTAWLGSPVPESGFLPMHGGYAFTPWSPDPLFQQQPTREFLFRDRHEQPLPVGEVPYDATRYPYASCELGGGIQVTYYHRPIVPPECVQAMAVVALGSGANLLGYYMYHGGSNPIGKHAYFNEFTTPRISYDFQAPLGEYGQVHASYHYLRMLHLFLQDFGTLLASMTVVVPPDSERVTPENTALLRYSARGQGNAGFLFFNNYQDHVNMEDHTGVYLRLELPAETLTLPRMPAGLTVAKDVSAILPFNLALADGVLLKYATAQLLTKLDEGPQSTYVFFTPQGMRAEFALDSSTYRSITVTGGTCEEEHGRDYVLMDPGLDSSIHLVSLDETSLRLIVLTEGQAHDCYKMTLWGKDCLVLTRALPLAQEDGLHLYWNGEHVVDVVFYPPLAGDIATAQGEINTVSNGYFTRYIVTLPRYQDAIVMQQLRPGTASIVVPAATLHDVHDVMLRIDYQGDMGQAYLNSRLVSDHFANGLPWEIGLKHFLTNGQPLELIVQISPTRQGDVAPRAVPTGMAFQPDSSAPLAGTVTTVTALPEYHASLIRR